MRSWFIPLSLLSEVILRPLLNSVLDWVLWWHCSPDGRWFNTIETPWFRQGNWLPVFFDRIQLLERFMGTAMLKSVNWCHILNNSSWGFLSLPSLRPSCAIMHSCKDPTSIITYFHNYQYFHFWVLTHWFQIPVLFSMESLKLAVEWKLYLSMILFLWRFGNILSLYSHFEKISLSCVLFGYFTPH